MTIKTSDISREVYVAMSLLAILLVTLTLSPMLSSGYISDDSWVSLKVHYPNIKAMLYGSLEQIIVAARSYGHLLVISTFFCNTVYHLLGHDPLMYKTFILIMVLVNVVLFEHFICKLTRSRIMGLLSIAALPVLFQFRNYHDPILSFAGGQQLILTTLLISLLFLLDYFDSGKKSKYWLSLVFYFFCIQIYENTYSFFLFHMMIIYIKDGKNNFIKSSLPFVLLPVLATVFIVVLKQFYPSAYSGTAAGFDFLSIFLTFCKQVIASFPLSYFFFYFEKDLLYDKFYIYRHYGPQIMLLMCASAVYVYYIFRNKPTATNRLYSKYVPLLGALFMVVPAMIISLSKKYQEELTWGIGYIPVYISYYGVSLLIAFIIIFIFDRTAGKRMIGCIGCLVMGMVFCSSAVLNYINNGIVVDNLNYTFFYDRSVITEAAKRKLFKPVPEGSILYINGNHHWDGSYVQTHRAFYDSIARKKFSDVIRSRDIENAVGLSRDKTPYYLDYASLSEDSGYAVLGKLLNVPHDDISEMRSREIYVYVRVPYYKPIVWDWNVFYPKISFWGKWSADNQGDSDFILHDYFPSVSVVSSGIGWRMYKIMPDRTINVRTMAVHVGREYAAVTHTVGVNQAIDFWEWQFLTKGWSVPESDHRWNEGKEANIKFNFKGAPQAGRRYKFVMTGSSNGKQRVNIILNGKDIGVLDFSGTYETKSLAFDSMLLRPNETNTFSMLIPNAVLPGNGDTRVLGISLNSLMVTDRN